MSMCYEVSIPANVAAISAVVDIVMERIHKEHARAAEIEFAIETALREALANAILHGCKQNAAKKVYCQVSCNALGEVQITVRDPGEGFDPASISDPLSEGNLLADHGRGVYLIRHLMDDVQFADGGREVRMRKS